jgi:hypothetical protein
MQQITLRWIGALFLALLLAGCAGRPPSPADLQAKRFEPLPDKAVIYLYRGSPDFSDRPASFLLDGQFHGSTYPGTYYRLELAPGVHRISGFPPDMGNLQLPVDAGRIYFVRQAVTRLGGTQSSFTWRPESDGRGVIMRAELLGAPAAQSSYTAPR